MVGSVYLTLVSYYLNPEALQIGVITKIID